MITDVGDSSTWWLGYIDVGDGCWRPNVLVKMILPPTSEISPHHKVANITMSLTSLSPIVMKRSPTSPYCSLENPPCSRTPSIISNAKYAAKPRRAPWITNSIIDNTKIFFLPYSRIHNYSEFIKRFISVLYDLVNLYKSTESVTPRFFLWIHSFQLRPHFIIN